MSAKDTAQSLPEVTHASVNAAHAVKFEATASRLTFWQPIWLRRHVLVSLSVLFLLLLAALVAISEVAKSRDGIRAPSSTHYVRTYAPTAILILLSAGWRQVDFHCKQLTPWKVLYGGQSPAASSLLLDYLSPLQIASFVQAYKNRHWAVVCTVTGYALLKALTVAATALFTTVEVFLPAAVTTVQKTPFTNGIDVSLNDLRSFGPAISFEAFGVSSQGLAERDGLSSSFLYETISPVSPAESHTYTIQAQVRGLTPVFECQTAPFQVAFPPANTTDVNPETRVELLFPECTLRGGNGQGTPIYSLNPSNTRIPPRQLSPLRQQIDCLNQTGENWQLLTLVDFRYNQTLGDDDLEAAVGDPVRATSWLTNVANAIGVACRSTYEISDVDLLYSNVGATSSDFNAQLIRSTAANLTELTNADIGGVVDSALRAGATMAGSLVQGSFDEDYPNTLFKIMAGIANGTYDRLLVDAVMLGSAQDALQQLALQSLDRHIRSASLATSPATISVVRSRLKVNEVAATITLVGFGLLSLLSAALIWVAPRNVIPHNPEQLASAVIALQDSPELQRILLRTKLAHRKLKHGLRGFLFASGLGYGQLPQPRCGILVSKDGEASPLMSTSSASDTNSAACPRWDRPAATRRWFLLTFMVLPLAIIGALEGIQHASDSDDGFVTIANPTDPTIAGLPQVLSAFVMLCVAAAFSSIEFSVLMLAPIHELVKERKSNVEALLLAYLGHMPPMVLFRSISRRHWAVLLVTTSALIGSVLTLVASGLYTLVDLDGSTTLDVQQLDQLTAVWSDSARNDSDAAVIQSLVESTNLGFPEFTYDELAFPRLEAGAVKVQDRSHTTLLEVFLPATRAFLNCTFLDNSSYNFTTDFNARILTTRAQISASIPLPQDCAFGGPNGNESVLEFTSTVTMASNASYIGKLLDVHTGPYDPILGSAAGELNPGSNPDNPPTCPTLAFWYGHASISNPSQTAASLLVCYQRLDLLNTTTTFTLPNMSISTLYPPRINTNTPPLPLFSPNITSPNHPFRPQLHFDNTFASLDTFLTTTASSAPIQRSRTCTFRSPQSESFNTTFDITSPALDPFFQGVLCASPSLQSALPVEILGLTDAASRARVFDAVHAFYRRYMAIAAGKNMRVPLSRSGDGDGGGQSVGGAGLVGPGGRAQGKVLNARKVVRLVQQRTVKWVLQGMLGVMVVCGGVGVWLCRLWRPVVQYGLGSVAGKMALFAGTGVGEEVSEVFEGIDGARVAERKKLIEVLGRWEWRLGWWDAGRERGVSGDVWGAKPVVREKVQKEDRNAGIAVLGKGTEGLPSTRVVDVEHSRLGWI